MLENAGGQWLTEPALQAYRENGFVQINDVLSPDELSELRGYFDEAMSLADGNSFATDRKDGAYYKVLNQKVDTWRDHAGMARYVLSARFAELARQLTGASAIRLFHDHALCKMPGDSRETPWHQDQPFWPMAETGALSIWLALDDVHEENGCMAFVPQSHRLGRVASIDFLQPANLLELSAERLPELQPPVAVRLKAGSCTFHDGLTFHYAYANKTDRPRRALAIIYMPDGTRFNGQAHYVTDRTGLQIGERITGPRNPVLASGRKALL